MFEAWKSSWKWHVNECFKGQNIMEREDSMELNFKGLEIQKWNISLNRTERIDEKIG